jgi:hypothetical protein
VSEYVARTCQFGYSHLLATSPCEGKGNKKKRTLRVSRGDDERALPQVYTYYTAPVISRARPPAGRHCPCISVLVPHHPSSLCQGNVAAGSEGGKRDEKRTQVGTSTIPAQAFLSPARRRVGQTKTRAKTTFHHVLSPQICENQ